MDRDYELKYYEIEDWFWLFVSRRDIILRLARGLARDSKILDIGCSSGPLIKAFQGIGFKEVWGIDTSKRAIRLCRKRGLKSVFLRDAVKTGFAARSFDVIISSDVLEHIEDDINALREWNRVLKKGGRLIVFVPAFSFLWSGHDIVNHHFRRYTKQSLEASLEKAGFMLERSSYWNMILFMPALILRTFQRMFFRDRGKNADQLYGSGRLINGILIKLMSLENFLIESINAPLGVSVFAVARKR